MKQNVDVLRHLCGFDLLLDLFDMMAAWVWSEGKSQQWRPNSSELKAEVEDLSI